MSREMKRRIRDERVAGACDEKNTRRRVSQVDRRVCHDARDMGGSPFARPPPFSLTDNAASNEETTMSRVYVNIRI